MNSNQEKLGLLLPGAWLYVDLSSTKALEKSCKNLVKNFIGSHDKDVLLRNRLFSDFVERFSPIKDQGGQAVFLSDELRPGVSWKVSLVVVRPVELAVPSEIANSLPIFAGSFQAILLENSDDWDNFREIRNADSHVLVRVKTGSMQPGPVTMEDIDEVVRVAAENKFEVEPEVLDSLRSVDNASDTELRTMQVEYWILREGIPTPTLVVVSTSEEELFENFEDLFDAVVHSSLAPASVP